MLFIVYIIDIFLQQRPGRLSHPLATARLLRYRLNHYVRLVIVHLSLLLARVAVDLAERDWPKAVVGTRLTTPAEINVAHVEIPSQEERAQLLRLIAGAQPPRS